MTIANNALTAMPEQDLAAVEAQIRDGDLLLCSGTRIFSRLIRWATKSPWSHVAIAMRADPLGRVMVLESVERIGVRTLPFHTFAFGVAGKKPYPGQIVLVRHATLTAVAHKTVRAMAAFAVDQLGDPFSPRDVLKIALRIILGSTNQKMPEAMKSQDEYICSEFVAICFEQAHVRIPWDGRGFIAPCDFANDPDVSAIARLRMLPK